MTSEIHYPNDRCPTCGQAKMQSVAEDDPGDPEFRVLRCFHCDRLELIVHDDEKGVCLAADWDAKSKRWRVETYDERYEAE
jgi:hypothetical protein